MKFIWLHFLLVAKIFVRQAATSGYQDALLRSAISRAYYAAFISARNFLRDKESVIFSSSADTHQQVANLFRNSSIKNRRQIGIMLYNLRILRNKADYSDDFLGLISAANNAIADAQRVIDTLAKLK